jgi:hypothetical protein
MIACRTALVFFAASACALPQWIDQPTPGTPRLPDGKPNLTAPAPRLPDGKPDLSGIWRPNFVVPYIPPGTVITSSLGPIYSLQFRRTNAAAIPMTPWAEAIFKERDRTFGVGRPAGSCLPHSIPDAMIADLFKIVQDPGLTLILYEEFARFRQVFTDGRALPKDPNPAWLGYSVGRWDHDTFIVDTAGFNDRSWLDDAGHPHSEALHTIERFRRLDFGHMDVEVNFDDTKAYTEPWSATLHFRLLPDTELIEDVCDNEKDAGHLVGRAVSDDKKKSIDVAPEILSQYAGAYELGNRPLDVSLSGGRLTLLGSELTPVSETDFSSSLGNVKFLKDDSGRVTRVIVDPIEQGQYELIRRPSADSDDKK